MNACLRSTIALSVIGILMATRLAADLATNGGFEQGFSGWEAGGNVGIRSTAPYQATEGNNLAVFNSVNSTPNGYLITANDVLPGRRYRLEFDVGNLSYNAQHQRMKVIVQDNVSVPPPPGARPPYVSDTIDIAGPGGGATAWVAVSYEFAAEYYNVRFEFRDVSQATNSLDLVLDHIRLTELPADPVVGNGGFESGLDGWNPYGNVAIRSASPYGPTEGTRLAVFNSGNSTPNGSISRMVTTVPGRKYRLEFDVGNLSYNLLNQRLGVLLVSGYKIPLVGQTIEIPGAGGGSTSWIAASFEFVAINTSANLIFSDLSQATNSLDLVLDHVRVSEIPSESLIVNGGFEAGLAGWGDSGGAGDTIESSPPYLPTEGARLLAFNTRNKPPVGNIVSQTVKVVPGKRYRLEFDVGNLSYNSFHQRMWVEVSEHVGPVTYIPVQDIIDIAGPGGGATAWVAASYEFIPQSDSVVIGFADVSQLTDSVDLVLDHVRLNEVP